MAVTLIICVDLVDRRDPAAKTAHEAGPEHVFGRQPVDGDHPTFRHGDEERTPRTGDASVDGDGIAHLQSLAQEGR